MDLFVDVFFRIVVSEVLGIGKFLLRRVLAGISVRLFKLLCGLDDRVELTSKRAFRIDKRTFLDQIKNQLLLILKNWLIIKVLGDFISNLWLLKVLIPQTTFHRWCSKPLSHRVFYSLVKLKRVIINERFLNLVLELLLKFICVLFLWEIDQNRVCPLTIRYHWSILSQYRVMDSFLRCMLLSRRSVI